jgi:hypothetical protein
MGRRKKRLWTNDEVAKLKSLAGKMPARDIAVEIGRGYAATVLKAHLLRIPLRVPRKREGSKSI